VPPVVAAVDTQPLHSVRLRGRVTIATDGAALRIDGRENPSTLLTNATIAAVCEPAPCESMRRTFNA